MGSFNYGTPGKFRLVGAGQSDFLFLRLSQNKVEIIIGIGFIIILISNRALSIRIKINKKNVTRSTPWVAAVA